MGISERLDMGGLCSAEERTPNPSLAHEGDPSYTNRDVHVIQHESKDAIAHVKAELDKVWVGLDQDRDGSVTKKELSEALNRTGLHNDKRIKQLFAGIGGKMHGQRAVFAAMDQLDEDGDGKISKDEFFAFFYLEAKLIEAFRQADTDLNGALSKDEFNKLLSDFPEIEVLMSRRNLKPVYVFEQLDADSSGTITVLEFLRALHGNQLIVDLFDAIDTDRDGLVTKQELGKALNDADQPQLMKYLKSVGIKPVNVFEQLDLNGDGTLTILEFMTRLKNLKAQN